MHRYGYTWPMGTMMLGWVLLTVLAIGVVVWLVVAFAPRRSPGGTGAPWSAPDDTSTARRILAERYARAELDTEEYTSRLGVLLRGSGQMGTGRR